MRRKIIRPEQTAPFLGIGTGKKAKAEAQAEIDKIKAQTEAALAIEQAKRDTLTLQLAQAQSGFNPVQDAQQAEIAQSKISAFSENSVYYVVGAVLLVAIYFLFRKN